MKSSHNTAERNGPRTISLDEFEFQLALAEWVHGQPRRAASGFRLDYNADRIDALVQERIGPQLRRVLN